MSDNKLTLKIANIKIPVATPEDEAYAVALAEDIDADMRQILDSNANASVTSAALLCAIDYLDSFRKANRSTNNLRNQIKEYLSDAANAKLQYDEECKKNAELTVELGAMRTHLTRIAAEGDATGAVEQLKSQLTKANTEINRGKKQIGELMVQINALAEKSNAMNEYISGQDKEIARLNSVIGVHLETIASLEEKLRAAQETRAAAAPAVLPAAQDSIAEAAHAEIQSVLEAIRADREGAPAPAAPDPAPAAEAPPVVPVAEPADPASAVEQTTLEQQTPAQETPAQAAGDLFFHPAAPAGEQSAAQEDIVEDLDEPEAADPIKKLEEEISDFPFDIDIDDKPEEFFRGEYAIKDRERAAERALPEREAPDKPQEPDDGLPDLEWTRDL